MTQENRKKLQQYLDARIFGTKRQMRSKYANERLNQSQKDDLYQIVENIKDIVVTKNNISILNDALAEVACCLRQIQFHGMMPNPKNSKNIVPRDKMPFLVKQVLWLICYKALEADFKQKDVFEKFHQHNIYVSQNFFSSLEQTPDYFFRCEKHPQPENPCKYKGQKKDELGMAIKNLVYQAGKHSYFVDIFGGSGSASVAVCRKRRVRYVYNEINPRVKNYVEQIAGRDFNFIADMLEKIQEDLKMSELSSVSKLGFSFNDELDAYISAKEKDGGFSIGVIDEERDIQRFGMGNYKFDVSSIKGILDKICKELQDKKKIHLNDIKIQNEINAVLEKVSSILSSNDVIQDFKGFIDWYDLYCKFYFYINPYQVKMTPMPRGFSFSSFTYEYYRQWVRRYKTLGYFAYFKNMAVMSKLSNMTQKFPVECAVGEIFLKYFAVRGTEVSTLILDSIDKGYPCETKQTIKNFIEEDFASKVKGFHKALSGTTTKNMGFRGIIKEYEFKNTLFYSDSPYIATSDYEDADEDEEEDSKFDDDGMKDLIKMLMQGSRASKAGNTQKVSKPNKFIFSMRAVKSAEEKGTSGKIVSGNRQIYERVYKKFAPYAKSLYVLVIYEVGKKLCTLMQKNEVIEIMITNYEIVSFEVEAKGKRYTCEVLKFSDYMKKIRKYMNGYDKSWDVSLFRGIKNFT